jgi:zinc protease
MNNRIWLLLFFMLLLPITLFFSHIKKTCTKCTAAPVVATTPITITAENITHSPVIQNWTTTNNTRVYFVATEGIPIIDIKVNFDAGSARDQDKPGLAAFMVHLLDQGISSANADQIAEQLEDTGAQLHAGVDRDRATISLRALTEPTLLNPVILLFADLISSPVFPDNSIETQRNQSLIAIKRNLQQPHTVASQAFFRTLYKNHPYSEPSCGTEAAVALITKNDLTQFHQQYFVANNATITIVGGISKEQATTIANQIAEKLPAGNMAAPIPDVTPLTEFTDINIPFPSEQTHVLTGQPCATENDPDYFTLLVGNYILGGGGLTSRLFKDVRDERGLVYNVSSKLMQLQKPAPFVIQLQTKNNQAKEAIAVLQNTLSNFMKEGPTEQEVLEAKQSITRAFPIEISNNAKIAEVVSNMAFYKLPLDTLTTYQQKVEAITAADIKSTFERRINPEKFGLIVVGNTQP